MYGMEENGLKLNRLKFKEKLNELMEESLQANKIESILKELANDDTFESLKPDQSLWQFFSLRFYQHFFDQPCQEYKTWPEYSAEMHRLSGKQPYKLHISLPLISHLTQSKTAAQEMYSLLKEAVANNILNSVSVLEGLVFDNPKTKLSKRIQINERMSKYSQLTLYLPKELKINELKELIYKINDIAKREGVYHSNCENCDTPVSGIISLRDDFSTGFYLSAKQSRPADVDLQNALPIIRHLTIDDEKSHTSTRSGRSQNDHQIGFFEYNPLSKQGRVGNESVALNLLRKKFFDHYNHIVQSKRNKNSSVKHDWPFKKIWGHALETPLFGRWNRTRSTLFELGWMDENGMKTEDLPQEIAKEIFCSDQNKSILGIGSGK